MGRAYGAGSQHRSIDALAARIALRQYGVFTRDQISPSGVSKRSIQGRVDAGRWEQLTRDVFRVAGAPPSWRQSLMTAALAWGSGAHISHRAAAALRDVPSFKPVIVELTVPRDRRRAAPGIVHRDTLGTRDVTVFEAIPVTTPTRTLLDLASMVDPDVLEVALDDAVRRRLVLLNELRRRAERSKRPGVKVLRSLLEARGSGAVPQSVFETKLLGLLRREGLPLPLSQYEIRSDGRLFIVDFAYPHERLAIEADGYRWHSGRQHWQYDLARRNALTLLGWRIIHVTWQDLTQRPAAVIDSIRAALG